MMVKVGTILFLLFISILEIVTQVKPGRGGTFIDFNKQERKIKEHPFIYAINCLHALLVVLICTVIACIVWNKQM